MNTLRLSLLCSILAAPVWAAEDVAPAAASPNQEVQFNYVAKVGDTARMKIVTRTFGSMDMFGAMLTQKFSQQFEQELVMKCIEVRPDKTSLHEMTLPNVAIRMDIGGIKIQVDTRQKDPVAASQPAYDLLYRVFTAITKIKCTVTFSPQGEPVKVEGLSEGMQKVFDELSDQLMPGMKQFFDQFRDQLADDMLEEQMRASFRLTPDGGKARVGDTWKREWQVKMPPFNILTRGSGQYELLGVEEFRGHTCAKIRVKSDLTTIPGQKPDITKMGGAPKSLLERMQFSMNSSGGNGIAYIDVNTGDLLQLRETQRSTIELSMEADPNATGEEPKEGLGKIKQNLNTSVQTDLLEKNGQPIQQSKPQ